MGLSTDQKGAIAELAIAKGRCFYLPTAHVAARLQISLRIARSRNNQTHGITGRTASRSKGYNPPSWGRSSAGRAPRWQRGGQGFEPPRLHSNPSASEAGLVG